MIYSIDFDGTIVENKFPAIGELNPEAFDFIRKIRENGDKWILFTMREGKYLEDAVAFLIANNISPDAINDNLPEMQNLYHNNPRKVYADVYIDDRNSGGVFWPNIKNTAQKLKEPEKITFAGVTYVKVPDCCETDCSKKCCFISAVDCKGYFVSCHPGFHWEIEKQD